MRHYIHQLLIGLDQLFNTILGGWADETLSARSFRLSAQSKFWSGMRIIIDHIFFFTPQHCYRSWDNERNRTQEPPEYREDRLNNKH